MTPRMRALHEPLKGMIPFTHTSSLKLSQPIPDQTPGTGMHLQVGWKRVIPIESWKNSPDSVIGYEIVSSVCATLPSPASYKTPEVLISAVFNAFKNEIIEADLQALDPHKVLDITYDEATKKFIFSCGLMADYLKLTLSERTAALFGYDEAQVLRLIGDRRYSSVPYWKEVEKRGVTNMTEHPDSRKDKQLLKDLREGLPYITMPPACCPASITTQNPAQLSLGVDNVYVESDLIDPKVWVGNRNRNVLAVVPIDFSAKGYINYTPTDPPYIRLNKPRVSSIRLALKDFTGHRIKFMSNDTSSVIAQLHFERMK